MVMTPYDYQTALANLAFPIINEHGLVYLAMEERTGKSITSLLVYENAECYKVNNVLIITKKKALDGWEETLAGCPWLKKNYRLTNYHRAANFVGWPDAVILDEAHAYISAFPKSGTKKGQQGKIWQDVRAVCQNNRPIVYLSATPYAQGIQLLFHQFSVSDFSPWAELNRNGYRWYDRFALRKNDGSFYQVRRNMDKYANDYTKIDFEKAFATCQHLFITKTRAELNFQQEPEDVLHYIELSEITKVAYNILLVDSVLEFTIGNVCHKLICDTKIKVRMAQHMIEGGVLKVDDDYLVLAANEKVDYIMKHWGDSPDVAIMYNYIAEGMKLRAAFKHAHILQATSYAEGIDLSHIKHLIVYSQDFSVARHTQRRARQANINRTDPIKVHFLLVKKAVSDQVYKAVSINKVNFVDSLFERNKI